jgi:hypothetical protein
MKKRPRKDSNARSTGRGAAGGSPAPKQPPGSNVTGRGRVRNIGRERVAQKAGDSGHDAEPSS